MADKNVDLSIRVGVNDAASGQIKRLESRIIRFVGAVSAALASVKLIAFPVTESAAFEREMKDVQKTTGFADDAIKSLAGSLKEMSTQLSVNADDLASIAAVAGQLGLGDAGLKAIEEFTKSVARASVTLGVTAEEAANAGATLANIFNIDVGNVEKIFSAVNELSNTSVAAGSDLIDIVKRVGNTADLEADKVVALAAYVKELGVPNEQAGTFLVKAFSNMLAEGKKFAEAMGVTQYEWIARVKSDAVEAFQAITKRLYEMEDGVRELYTKELFGSGRLFSAANKAIADVANGQAKLTQFLNSSNRAFVEGTSSVDEYRKIVEAVSEQYTILLNKLNVIAIDIGEKLLPVLRNVITELQESLDSGGAQLFFDNLGTSLVGFVTNVRDAIKWVANLDVVWSNVIQTIKLFLGFEIAKTIVGLSASLAKAIVRVDAYTASWLRASAAQSAATSSAGAATSAGATSSFASLLPIIGLFNSQVDKSREAFAATRQEAIRLYNTEVDAIAVERNKAFQVQQTANARLNAQIAYIERMKLERKAIMANSLAEKKRLIQEANGNKKILAQVEAAWAQRMLWAKNYYNLIKREETKLTALRRSSAAAGIGVGPADAAASQKQQAALKALNQSYLAQRKNVGIIGGLLASAIGLAKNLGKVLLNVGKTLLSFAGGWVGLAVTGLIIFWDEIKGFLGFITKEEEDSRKKALEAAKLLNEAEIKAKEAADRASKLFKDFKASNTDTDSLDLDNMIKFKNASSILSSMKSVVNQFGALVEASNEAGVSIKNYETLASGAFTSLARARADLAKAEEAYREKESQLDRSRNINIKQTSSELLQLKQNYEIQKTNVKEYEIALKNANEALGNQRRLLKELQAELSNIGGGAFGKIFDEATVAYGSLEGEVVDLVRRLRELQDQALKSKNIYEEMVVTGADAADLGFQLGELNANKREVDEVSSRLGILRDRVNLLKQSFTPAQREAAKFIDSLTDKGKQGFREYSDAILKAVRNHNNLIETLSQNAPQIVAQAAVWKQVQRDVKAASSEILGFKANAKGVLDNTNSEVRSLISSINDFRASIQSTFADTKFTLSLRVDDKENKLQKRLEEDIDWVESYYDRRIANATNDISKKRLEQWKQESIEIRKNIASKKLAELEERKLQALLDRSKENYLEYAQAAQKAAEKAASSGDKEAAASALFNKELAQDELKKFMDNAKKIINLTYKDITGKDRQLIDESQLSNFEKSYAEMASGLASITPDINQGAFTGFEKAAKPLEQALIVVNSKLSEFDSKIAILSQTYKGFAEVVDQANTNIKEVVPELDRLLGDFRNQLGGVVSGAIRGADFDFTKISKGLAEEINKAINIDSLGSRFKEGIKIATSIEFDPAVVTSFREKLVAQFKAQGIAIPEDAIIPPQVFFDLTPNKNVQEDVIAFAGSINGVKIPYDLVPRYQKPSGQPLVPQSNKEGGYITGPGTGTSDSILSWLSNGEYVIDAMTTRFFGSRFFKGLQSVAKGKRSAPSLKGAIPAFAGGGLVSSAFGSISREKVATFYLGGKSYEFSAAEDTINDFGRSIKTLSTKRSRIR